MKKTIFISVLIFAFAVYTTSQTTPVSHYVFLQDEEGTYLEISEGTVHGTTANDDESFNAIDIGFAFNFNGTDYTQISIQTNGFIAMGSSVNEIMRYPISDDAGSNNVISPFTARWRTDDPGKWCCPKQGFYCSVEKLHA